MSSIWTIRRSATDTKVTGLCGGVARHWGVDPLLVRIGCALLALSGGVGIVLYAAGWLLIPVEGQDKRPVDDLFGGQIARWSKEAWIAVVAVTCIVVFVLLGSLMPFGFGPAVILGAVWYFGYYRNRTRTAPPPVPSVSPYGASPQPFVPDPTQQFPSFQGPSTPFTQAAQAWQQRVADVTDSPAPAPTSTSTPTPTLTTERTWEPSGLVAPLPGPVPIDARSAFLAQPDPVGLYVEAVPEPAVPRHRTRSARRLRLVGLLVLGLVLSGIGLLDRLGVAVPISGYLAAALLVVGLTLVAATWFGRARGVLALGLVLAVAVLATSVAGPVASMQGWGVKQHTYATAADLPTTPISQDVGQLRIDLAQVEVPPGTVLTAHVDAGSLVVTVPENTNVRIQYVVDSGVITAFGNEVAAGTDLRETIEPVDPDPTDPTMTLQVSVDVGEIRVQR